MDKIINYINNQTNFILYKYLIIMCLYDNCLIAFIMLTDMNICNSREALGCLIFTSVAAKFM